MLELRKGRQWRWAASGKHPVARDYVSIGRQFPLAAGFSDWVAKSYPLLRRQTPTPCCWRFWARGTAGDEIACGLLRESSDRIGRPFPFLVMGSGPLPGWAEHWDRLTLVCADLWGEMEKLSVKPLRALPDLEEALHGLRAPLPEWGGAPAGITDLPPTDAADYDRCRGQLGELAQKDAGFVVLDRFEQERDGELVFIGDALKRHGKGAPSSMFLGGTPDSAFLAFFRRPLSVADFSTLWSELPQRQHGANRATEN